MSIEDQVESGKLIRIHGEPKRRTEKAILFEMESDISCEEWFPLSQLHEDSKGLWYCREWLAKEKGLI